VWGVSDGENIDFAEYSIGLSNEEVQIGELGVRKLE
jgi:hypothetical protein